MTYNYWQIEPGDDVKNAAKEAHPPDPKHAARATRMAGRQMRSRLLDAASRLFRERGLASVSIAEIAAAADAFPSQITYYFRTKEALFVEAACREALYVARAAEQHAGKQLSPSDYTRALVESVMVSDALGFFVEAMTLTRRRQDLAPLIERTVERLHAEGLRAYAAEMAARGWQTRLRSGNQRTAFLGDRDRRHARGAGDGPCPRDARRRDAAPVGPAGRCASRRGPAQAR